MFQLLIIGRVGILLRIYHFLSASCKDIAVSGTYQPSTASRADIIVVVGDFDLPASSLRLLADMIVGVDVALKDIGIGVQGEHDIRKRNDFYLFLNGSALLNDQVPPFSGLSEKLSLPPMAYYRTYHAENLTNDFGLFGSLEVVDFALKTMNFRPSSHRLVLLLATDSVTISKEDADVYSIERSRWQKRLKNQQLRLFSMVRVQLRTSQISAFGIDGDGHAFVPLSNTSYTRVRENDEWNSGNLTSARLYADLALSQQSSAWNVDLMVEHIGARQAFTANLVQQLQNQPLKCRNCSCGNSSDATCSTAYAQVLCQCIYQSKVLSHMP